MALHGSGSGVVRDRFFSTDPAEIEKSIGARFTDYALRPSRTAAYEAGYEAVAASGLVLGHAWSTTAAVMDVAPMPDTFVVEHMRGGTMTRTGPAYGEVRTGPGETVVVPPVGGFHGVSDTIDVDLVALDATQVAHYAEYTYGIAETDLRITGLTPRSASRDQEWNATVARIRDEVLGNPVLAESPVVLDRAVRCLTTAFLSTFPNTAFEAAANRRTRFGSRHVPASVLGEVREYLTTHAGEPFGPEWVSVLAGNPAYEVADALWRLDGIHPAHALWRARLCGARRALREADPESTDVPKTAARWGFVRPGAFRIAYVRVFGEYPEDTLRR